MKVMHVEVLVEEPSMEEALRQLLPRLLGGISFQVYVHQCKDDLLARLPERLRGYSSWLPEDWRIVVVIDRDDDDCEILKRRLEKIAKDAGLVTRSAATDGASYSIVNRIAVEELEAWYFGDWVAVRSAFPRVPETIPAQERYRDPDAIRGGTWEALERILQQYGYFKGGLRKIEAARSISAHMSPFQNRSQSFQALRDVLVEIASTE